MRRSQCKNKNGERNSSFHAGPWRAQRVFFPVGKVYFQLLGVPGVLIILWFTSTII